MESIFHETKRALSPQRYFHRINWSYRYLLRKSELKNFNKHDGMG